MPVKKTYDLAATKAAIDRADNWNINKLKLVRSDISNADFNKGKIKIKDRNPNVPPEFQYPGKRDVGHTFRHVEGTHAAGKSIYVDDQTAVAVTRQLLNSSEGQQALGELDAENRDLYDNTTRRVTAAVTGDWYGKKSGSTKSEKIATARCEIMKLGGDILWIHSSYPYQFQVDMTP